MYVCHYCVAPYIWWGLSLCLMFILCVLLASIVPSKYLNCVCTCMCVWHMSVCMCVGVWPMCTCAEVWGGCHVLCSITLPYCLRTGCLTEPGALWGFCFLFVWFLFSTPVWSTSPGTLLSASPTSWQNHDAQLLWVLRIRTQVPMLARSSQLDCLPSPHKYLISDGLSILSPQNCEYSFPSLWIKLLTLHSNPQLCCQLFFFH